MSDTQPYVLAFDIGTSSLKAVVYAFSGKTIASESFRYEMTSPAPGWAEANTKDWESALHAVLSNLKNKGNLLSEIQVVAFTGQMHTAVLLDENLEALAPTILWLDRRAIAETDELIARWNLPPHQLNSTYTLPKILWLRRHQPDRLARVQHIIWPKDYLRFLLTSSIMTDVTEAGGAGLLDWNTNLWAEERLVEMGVNPAILPPLKQPGDDAGFIKPEFTEAYGINPRAKVIVGAGDVLALISSAPPMPGRVTCSLGSSSMVFSPISSQNKIVDPLNRIYTYPLLQYPLLGGVSSTTGAALKWACQNLFPDLEFDAALETALATPKGGDGLLFVPFLSGERSPFWNDQLRGGFYGLTLSSSRAAMVRAVMEGVAYSLKYLIDIFNSCGEPIHEIAVAGGGAITKGWPQIIADVCQIPICICTGQETVTHALFAYACQAMNDGRSFDQALLQTFDLMDWVSPNLQAKEIYGNLYERYCRITEFLHQNIK
jgi:xylulokinase